MLNPTKLCVWACACAGVMASTVSAAVYIDEDFESYSVDTNPTSASYVLENGTTTIVNVVSSSNSRIGPGGNKSLLIQDDDAGASAAVSFRGTLPEDGIESGSLTFVYAQSRNSSWPVPATYFRLGNNSDLANALGAGEIGVQIYMDNVGRMYAYGPAATPFTLVPLGTPASAGNAVWLTQEPLTITIEFNTTTDTFAVYESGVRLVSYADQSIDTFSFTAPQSGIDQVDFITLQPTADNQFFIDDVLLEAVPEPASLALVGPAGLMGLWRRAGR